MSTSWSFEYGRTEAYGQRTAESTLTAGNDDESVASRVEGLEPGTTYHFRLVARNATGETLGEDATFRTVARPGSDPEPTSDDPAGDDSAGDDPVDPDEPIVDVPAARAVARPRPGRRPARPHRHPAGRRAANAAPASGTVEVRVPGSNEFVMLTEGASIPMGSTVDATAGQVTITSAADSKGQSRRPTSAAAQFKITQKRAAKPITDITLSGGDFKDCFPRALGKDADDVFAAGRRKASPPAPVGQRPRPLPHARTHTARQRSAAPTG